MAQTNISPAINCNKKESPDHPRTLRNRHLQHKFLQVLHIKNMFIFTCTVVLCQVRKRVLRCFKTAIKNGYALLFWWIHWIFLDHPTSLWSYRTLIKPMGRLNAWLRLFTYIGFILYSPVVNIPNQWTQDRWTIPLRNTQTFPERTLLKNPGKGWLVEHCLYSMQEKILEKQFLSCYYFFGAQ